MSFNKLYARFFLDFARFCVISHNQLLILQITKFSIKQQRESYEKVHVSLRRFSCSIGFYKL